jgi:hypothetical protein
MDFALFLGILGPAYALLSANGSMGSWEAIMNFYLTSQVMIPGPDPNPVRFIVDENLPAFTE